MGLLLACKAFLKAFKEPMKANEFLNEKPKELEAIDPAHLRLLAILQQQGRLIDFFKEDIGGYSDTQVGGAVRQIHADCAKSLEELVTIRAVREENEGSIIRVEKGYDPSLIKVIGKVTGEPPYSGVLIHKGWKAHKKSLPKNLKVQTYEIICPAEVEIK